MIRLLSGSFLAAFVMFIWGWIYWGVIGSMINPYQAVDGETGVSLTKAAQVVFPGSGVYYYPMPVDRGNGDESSMDAEAVWADLHRKGPLMEIYYVEEGHDPMSPLTFGLGFLQMLATALLLAFTLSCIVRKAPKQCMRYGSKVFIITLIGLISATWIDMSKVVWFYHPFGFELFNWVYHVSGMLFGGLILSAFIKGRTDDSLLES